MTLRPSYALTWNAVEPSVTVLPPDVPLTTTVQSAAPVVQPATGGAPQTFHMLHRVFKPGEDIGFHTHSGVEISWVVRGTIELRVRGGESKRYKAGESFLIPRGVVHDPVNVGSDEAEVAVNYVLDKGAPMRNPVP